MLRNVPFTIANTATASGIVDLGADGEYVVAVIIDGTWTAGKVGFSAYVPGSATIQNAAQFSPAVLGGTGAWVGGPFDSTAVFDTVKDNTGAAILYGNGTDTTHQYIAIPEASFLKGTRWVKVTSANAQAQAVTGYLLVRKD